MKILKLCSLFILLTLSMGLVPLKNENIPLTKQELTDIFPDSNFRDVIYAYFPNEDITLSKLKSLDGEFYASKENIEDLTGISTLESIDSFIFWNNNIKTLPKEILNLNSIKYINIENNYLTESNVVESLEKKSVEVDHDLNFIPSEKSQYELCSNKTNISLSKNEKINIRSLLYKSIDNYANYWEPSKELSKNCKLYIQTNNPALTTISKGGYISFTKEGTYYIIASLSENKYTSSTVIIKTVVK